MAKKNIWILGGTGYIGSALVKHLAGMDGYRLHLLVHRNVPYKFLEPFSVYTGSLENFDLSWMEKYPPDIIFHLARLGGSHALIRRYSAFKGAKANERILRFITGLRTSPVIVYVSGSLMYGHRENGSLAHENSELNPVSYGRYYYRAEEPLLQAQRAGLIDIRFARPGWILGPGSWLDAFYRRPFLQNGRIPLYGNGSQLMSLIHLYDCAAQIVKLAEKGEKNQNLNVFSGHPLSQKEFAEMLAKLLNSEVEHIPVPRLIKKYGPTVTDALISSIPLKTIFPALSNPDSLLYPDAASMLESVVSFFKNKQGIFPETP